MAQQIKEKQQLEVTVDKRHIIAIGERLYTESVELLRELTNNAYDADANDGRGVVSIIYRKQSDFLYYEIEKQYRFEPGRRDPGLITAEGLPDSIDGQKVFWPRNDRLPVPLEIACP